MASKLQKIALLVTGAGLGVVISVSYSVFAEKSSATAPLPIDELRAFSTVFGLIKQAYVEPVDDKKLINEAIKGMVSGLDPHSSYLDVEGYKDLQSSTQGEFGGLGIEVNMEDGLVKVISPIEDTPAYRAGIKSGDFIAKIDETQVQGLTLNEAISKMRGKPGTSIVLTVLRKGEARPLVITLKRDIIKVQSVKFKLAEPGYGYIRVAQFQERTTEDLAKAIETLYRDNKSPLKGIVLDLRNDPGGLLDGAVGVAAAFLPKESLVVYTDGRLPDAKFKYTATPLHYVRGLKREYYEDPKKYADELANLDYFKSLPADIKNVPLVVLVNGGSASASEIVAGALQDHKRALVVGTQTFGKGSVQTIIPIDPQNILQTENKTAVKLTTARYFTPGGRSIQAKGIAPDIEVEEATVNGREDNGFRIREADLDRHLDNPTDKAASQPVSAAPKKPQPDLKVRGESKPTKAVASQVDENAPRELVSKNDYQLQQSFSILKVQQLLLNKAASKPAAK